MQDRRTHSNMAFDFSGGIPWFMRYTNPMRLNESRMALATSSLADPSRNGLKSTTEIPWASPRRTDDILRCVRSWIPSIW